MKAFFMLNIYFEDSPISTTQMRNWCDAQNSKLSLELTGVPSHKLDNKLAFSLSHFDWFAVPSL